MLLQGLYSAGVSHTLLIYWLTVTTSSQDEELKQDDLVRETIKELQAVDREQLDVSELEEFLKLIYRIHGKLSYALTIVDTLHK